MPEDEGRREAQGSTSSSRGAPAARPAWKCARWTPSSTTDPVRARGRLLRACSSVCEVIPDKCIGCELCYKVCPWETIEMETVGEVHHRLPRRTRRADSSPGCRPASPTFRAAAEPLQTSSASRSAASRSSIVSRRRMRRRPCSPSTSSSAARRRLLYWLDMDEPVGPGHPRTDQQVPHLAVPARLRSRARKSLLSQIGPTTSTRTSTGVASAGSRHPAHLDARRWYSAGRSRSFMAGVHDRVCVRSPRRCFDVQHPRHAGTPASATRKRPGSNRYPLDGQFRETDAPTRSRPSPSRSEPTRSPR